MQGEFQIPFDLNQSLRAQVEGAVLNLPSQPCNVHPNEMRPVDTTLTIAVTVNDNRNFPNLTARFSRCSDCPYDNPQDKAECGAEFWFRLWRVLDEHGKPLPVISDKLQLNPDCTANDLLQEWALKMGSKLCNKGSLVCVEKTITSNPQALAIRLQYCACLQCGAERCGVSPDEARASFDNLDVRDAAFASIASLCRSWADDPKGILLMAGNPGTGKTHLAVSILRQLLRSGRTNLHFLKHRNFLARHFAALRPVRFTDTPGTSPLSHCQKSGLLVYDDLTAAADVREEEVLLGLFDFRIGRYLPTVITTNIKKDGLERALGSRLYDRLRGSRSAMLTFGFPSRRADFNQAYLERAKNARQRA